MPTYEYQCEACGEHVEKFQKMSDAPLVDCPHCGQPKLQRQLSASGFQLKGTGWYVTDFRDKNKPVKSEENKTESSEKKADDKKVDDKPVEKKADDSTKKSDDKKE